MNLERLWAQRREAWLRETLPNWKYVIGSGLGLAFGGAVLAIFHTYAGQLAAVKAGGATLPLAEIGAVLLSLAMLWNPARTYLRDADIVFLLPVESGMKAYFAGAWKIGLAMSFAVLLGLLGAAWPFYRAFGGGGVSFVAAASLLAGWKLLLYAGAWTARHITERGLRLLFRTVSTLAVFLTIYVWMTRPPDWIVVLGTAAVWGSYSLQLRACRRGGGVPWEALIEAERAVQVAYTRWFSLFIDLPHAEETFRSRPYFSGLLRLLGHRPERAYHYLFWRRLLRSSLCTVVVRLVVLEAALVALFPEAASAVGLFLLFSFLAGVQLRTLAAKDVGSLLAATAPIATERKQTAAAEVRRIAHAVTVGAMAVPLLFVQPQWEAAAAVAVGLVMPFWFARVRRSDRNIKRRAAH